MIPPESEPEVRQRSPAPPVFTTVAVADVAGGWVGAGVGVGVGGGVGVVVRMLRYAVDAHPSRPPQVMGAHSPKASPRSGTVTPSPITVMMSPVTDGTVRHRNPAPPVFTTVAVRVVPSGIEGSQGSDISLTVTMS